MIIGGTIEMPEELKQLKKDFYTVLLSKATPKPIQELQINYQGFKGTLRSYEYPPRTGQKWLLLFIPEKTGKLSNAIIDEINLAAAREGIAQNHVGYLFRDHVDIFDAVAAQKIDQS